MIWRSRIQMNLRVYMMFMMKSRLKSSRVETKFKIPFPLTTLWHKQWQKYAKS